MVAPVVQAAAVSAGANILGSVFGGKSSTMAAQRDAAKQRSMWRKQFQFQKDQYNYAKKRDLRVIQDRVADARAAGLHPLYALGASGGSLPTFASPAFIPGQHTSGDGSSTGAAIASGIGDVASAYFDDQAHTRRSGQLTRERKQAQYRQGQIDEQNARVAESMIMRNNAEALKAASEAKTAVARLRESPTSLVGSLGPPVAKRQLDVKPNVSVPARIEMVSNNGRRSVVNPELGLDEVGQVDYVLSPLEQAMQSLFGYSGSPVPLGQRLKNRIRRRRKYWRQKLGIDR